jgi:RNA polymerase sigma-70 factor, ECF subfamily
VTGIERDRLQREVRALLADDYVDRASTLVIEACGAEITRWLEAILGDETKAKEVFCAFCEDLWKGLPNFRWECSLRTWAYRLARNAAWRHLRSASPEQPVGDALPYEPVEELRSATRPWLRTDVKSAFARMREMLDPEDRALLLLRIDGRLAWEEVAEIVWDAPKPVPAEALRRKAAALRQQFRRIKSRLREMARDEGLLACRDQ